MGNRRLGKLGWNDRVRICIRKRAGLGGTLSISARASASVNSFIIFILVAIRFFVKSVRSSRAIEKICTSEFAQSLARVCSRGNPAWHAS
jgi:hypothetical protein